MSRVPVEMPQGVSHEGVFGQFAEMDARNGSYGAAKRMSVQASGVVGGVINRAVIAQAPPPMARPREEVAVNETRLRTNTVADSKLQSDLISVAAGASTGNLRMDAGRVAVEALAPRCFRRHAGEAQSARIRGHRHSEGGARAHWLDPHRQTARTRRPARSNHSRAAPLLTRAATGGEIGLQSPRRVPQGPGRQSRRDRRARDPHAARDGHRQRRGLFRRGPRLARTCAWPTKPFHIGPAPSAESYLRIDRILDAARPRRRGHPPRLRFPQRESPISRTPATAPASPSSDLRPLHPRHGLQRRGAADSPCAAGVPVVPGTDEPVSDTEDARRAAHATSATPCCSRPWPAAAAKVCGASQSEEHLEAALRDASSEAERAFGDAREVYVEKVIDRPRHIEIQILGDRHGNLIHLGERECSIQRRHQKVIEECPSPLVAAHPDMRAGDGRSRRRVARAAGLLQRRHGRVPGGPDRRFYFLEMNTRLQVEHPVTELVTGLDLVHCSFASPPASPLPLQQDDVTWRGSAIECRIYAEDPDNDFFPSPGTHPAAGAPRRPRHPPGFRRLSGLDGPDGIRPAAGEARRLGRGTASRPPRA